MTDQFLTRDALRLLEGLESGQISSSDAYQIASNIDPFLLASIFKYLRSKYPPTSQASGGVLSRLVELGSTYPEIVARIKKGEKDILFEWFEETYDMQSFFSSAKAFIDIIVDKIEG
jgi:hypothetical protein